MPQYYVYIMTNYSGTLYTGVTNDIVRRVYQHRAGEGSEFAAKYNIRRLVYVESCVDVGEAIAREKQIKAWRRAKKVALIESVNPEWKDLLPETG